LEIPVGVEGEFFVGFIANLPSANLCRESDLDAVGVSIVDTTTVQFAGLGLRNNHKANKKQGSPLVFTRDSLSQVAIVTLATSEDEVFSIRAVPLP